MGNNPFVEEKAEEILPLKRKLSFFPTASFIEKASYIMAIAILAVIVVVMTTDIKAISVQNIKDLSLSMFVLIFCTYCMYVNMYGAGSMAGEKTDRHKDIIAAYNKIKSEVITRDSRKDLAIFCRYIVEKDHKERIEEALIPVGISFEDFEKVRDLSVGELIEKGFSKRKIQCIKRANLIRPIKLTPEMLYKQCKGIIKRGLMHMQPEARKKFDMIKQFVITVLTSGAMGIIVFEVFSDPSWSTVCAVVFKVFAVAFTGYRGYVRGYDNIVTDTVLFTQDQIDILEQFRDYRSAKQNGGKEECAIA